MKTKIGHFLFLAILGNLLFACTNEPRDKPKIIPSFKETQLINEGTVCLHGKKNNDIKVYYFPHNSTCLSSSLNRWSNKKLMATASLRRSLKGSIIEIESSVTHRRSNSHIATSDCAGAGIQSKRMIINGNHNFEVFWGGSSLGRMDSKKGALLCRTRDKNGKLSPALDQMVNYVQRFGDL